MEMMPNRGFLSLPSSAVQSIVGAMLTVILALSPVAATPVPVEGSPVFVGAGDIASCYDDNDEATARVLDGIDGVVFTLGDNAYDAGLPQEFASCYDPTWGRHLDRTHPVPGNHDYYTPGAAGYFGYFGARAGNPAEGYYSFDVGAWHIVTLNTNCAAIGGCGEGSAQLEWLRADLAAHPTQCTLALSHHPRYSSGGHDADVDMVPIWEVLHAAGAEVVLSGHDHTYERFAPQDPAGQLDIDGGIRQFVVGTGGAGLYAFGTIRPNSEVRDNTTFGVLKLTLRPASYEWMFVPVEGGTFTDAGSTVCH